MSVVTAGSPTHSSAFQDRDERNDCNTVVPSRTLVWALVDALAYAGAFFDPSGVLAGHRFRRIQENELRQWSPVSELIHDRGPSTLRKEPCQ